MASHASFSAALHDDSRTDLNEVKGHLEIALLEKHFLERGLKPLSNFKRNLTALSSWYSIYTSAIAFIVSSARSCYSYVGRRGYSQTVSLDQQGCLYHSTVQHELLHALRFNHEQCRSDRDQHIRILWENIQSGWAYAFDKINTLNLNTPYDYNSVMQYHRYAFSRNNKPTMVPIPNANVEFDTANQMSRNDISRLNTLGQSHQTGRLQSVSLTCTGSDECVQ
ncbi:hypothetical protein KUCAC02_007107, partial [Chaenocephalus aceratus]